MKVISLDDLSDLGRCEHSITVKGLTQEEVYEILKANFPEVCINSRGNFVVNIRKDPAHTRKLLDNIFFDYPRVCIEWYAGNLTEDQVNLSSNKLERLFG